MTNETSKPAIAQTAPYKIAVEEGKPYYWCSCGLSEKQPFCDGSHKGTGLKSFSFQADASKDVYLCGCKATKNPPFCDGSHSTLPAKE